MKMLIGLIVCSALSFADTFQGGTNLTSTTPIQFSSTLGNVQKVTLHMVPGVCEKVFIGGSGMVPATLFNVYKVMYPNCSGGLSDSWTLQDNSGANGINTANIFIAGSLGGQQLGWETLTSTITPSKFLTLVLAGPCPGCNIVDFGGPGYDVIQAGIVPGFSGKIDIQFVSGTATTFDIMYPNNGVVTGNITEKWELYAVSTNGLNQEWRTIPEVPGEYPVIGVWKRM